MNIRYGGWWEVRPFVYACAAAKCGSMSLRQSIFGVSRLSDVIKQLAAEERCGSGPFAPWEVNKLHGRKVLGVRDPVERFQSLYRDKCAKRSKSDPGLCGLSPDELMALIESYPAGNTHWMPQSFYAVPGVELVRYDRLLEYLELEHEHINQSPQVTIPKVPVERIRRFYAIDQQLWTSANAAA